jgi:3-hydroxyisobutyrate dehydrogenase-like beta-hydroxyacid dehydrogenase
MSKAKYSSTVGLALYPNFIFDRIIGHSTSLTHAGSTVHPETTRALEERYVAQGAEFVAMPVFGAPAMADAGQLIAVPAGPASSIAKVKPYTDGV